jgi:hypothetical protein
MKMYSKLISIALLLCISIIINAQTWTPKKAVLMSQWASKVSPVNALPEYPRPQMVRKDWVNLNGVWQFQSGKADDAVPSGKDLSGVILVPYPVEAPLSGVMQHYDRIWYRRTFTISPSWKNKQIMLNFGAVDWESEVYINGKSVGVHKGGYDGFSYDITPFLKETGSQEVIVRVYDPTDLYGAPRGKQTIAEQRYGIMYTPTTGIWRTVWLEPVEKVSISNLKLIPDIDGKRLKITVTTSSSESGVTVTATAKEGSKSVGIAVDKPGSEFNLPLANPKLWPPEDPFLYDLTVTLKKDGKTLDIVNSYFGMRKVSLGTEGGFNKIFINNKFLFEIGPLDQGFWPDGIYTAPTDEALKFDIAQMKAHGFNFIRKHIKVEPDRWYYWCDKLGVMVWQDMPSANSYMSRGFTRPPVDTLAYKLEFTRLIESHWSFPSIIMWVVFNESQGQHNTPGLVKLAKELDPSRLVNQASGGTNVGVGDLLDVHSYPEPSAPVPTVPNQALVCGEFGGLTYRYPGHEYDAPHSHGYLDIKSIDGLVNTYRGLVTELINMKNDKGLSAAVYTETSDVETEVNGWLTYDRLLKVDPLKLKAINDRLTGNATVTLVDVLPVAQKWKFTTVKPAGEWNTNTFNDSTWFTGQAMFGTAAPSDKVKTNWAPQEVWTRQIFNPGTLTAEDLNNLVLYASQTNGIEVFVNGILAGSKNQRGGSGSFDYSIMLFNGDVGKTLKPNDNNIIAVHFYSRRQGNRPGNQQSSPGIIPPPVNQFFDVGISKAIIK